MTEFQAGLIIGIFIGGFLGILITGCLIDASRADEKIERRHYGDIK